MFKFTLGQDLGYIKRWVFECPLFSIRLHHWKSSDDLRNPHDHAWDFITIILKGYYHDITPNASRKLSQGTIKCRKAEHQHSVKVPPEGCWTLLLTGPVRREWGFWVNGRFRKRNKYFYEWGHH